MSGDVQPRKRKDKRRRKDELSVEEPRGTAAVLGDGDVFMHSYHENGTGGHWCAKVIFFSLLAVLVTLIGLIILENRGLSELEANSVESRYSGVLEGWIEDAPDDDHHDEHTLELKHHDEDDEEDDEHHSLIDEDHDNDEDEVDDANGDDDDDNDLAEDGNDEIDDVNEDNEDDENEDENDSQEDDDNEDDADEDQTLNSAENEEDEDENDYRKYYERLEKQQNDNDDVDGKEEDDDEDDDFGDNFNYNDEIDNDDADHEHDSNEENVFEDNEEKDNNQQLDDSDDDDDDEEKDNDERDEDSYEREESHTTRRNEEEGDEEDEEEDAEVEVEKIEKEVSDEEVLEEAATSAVEEDEKSGEYSEEETPDEDQTVDEEDQTDDEEEFLEDDDIEEPPVVERITAPPGKPLPEVEEETSSEKPQDTLAEEEEYERQQEELRRQQEQASHLWLKVAVGGALLVATHALVRRATAPRDASSDDEHISREETPSAIDRRMTLIAEEPIIGTDEPEEIIQPTVEKELEKIATVASKSVPLSSEKSEEEEEEEMDIETKNVETGEPENDDEDKELYSDEEEVEEEIEPEILEEKKETPKQNAPAQLAPKEAAKEAEQDEEVPEDVEIIDDEQLEEELAEEEEEDEEDISDVDDAELLSRLEAKYGRLPEPERPGPKKDGGNSLEDEWPGEPTDQYWRQQLDEAEAELRQAAARGAGAEGLRGSARARYIRARALDAAAEARRDNRLLTQAIAAYLELLKMNERLSDKKLLEVSNRTLDRIRFRGNYMNAEPVYRMLIRRFPDDPSHRNNLSITFLMANRPDLAEQVLKETLMRWPDDRIALAHLGFVLKTSHNKLEEAVDAMRKALEGDIGAANEPRFYFHLGDALLMLGRLDEAHEVHKRGAALGHFLSPAQRSLYNVDRLKSRPWWDIEQTPYQRLAHALEASWKSILKEGEAARALYEKEKEGLKERGEWSQLDLFVRGQELPGRCKKAPVTCSIVRQEIAAAGCKRGQIKFSAMEAGTHVRPHVGPTNCRLRIHLGLSNTKDTYIRVDKETRQWQTGKVLMFDDSFEHEVWHNGTGTRLVLIVDVWHPDLTPTERRQLPAI